MPNLLPMNMTAPLLRLSLVFMTTSMEITFNCSFLVRSFLLGLLRVPPQMHPQIPWITETLVHQTWTIFSTYSFDCNSPTNDNQTFKVYMKSMLIVFRKGLCGFFLVSGFTLEEKLHGVIGCKFWTRGSTSLY